MVLLNRLNIKVKYLLAIVLFVTSFCATAKTSVWEVSKGDKRLFLGGTVHVLSEKDFPLPCEYQTAFLKSDKVYFEADVTAFEKPSLQAQILQQGMYPQGESILNKITPQTANLLSQYFVDAGISGAAAMVKFKPGMLLSVLTIMELGKLGITAQGVDQHYLDAAKAAGKTIAYLETPDKQLEFLYQLGIGNEDKFVRYLVETINQLDSQFPELIKAWRTGNMQRMAEVIDLNRTEQEFPSIYNVLIVQRNLAWLKRIEAMLIDSAIEYVLVGGAHMAGKVGLLEQLKLRGYNVQQLDACS